MHYYSVIVATYNRKDLLKQCLESLFRQTYPQDNYEVIVVDDESNDGTIAYLDSLDPPVQFSYYTQKNQGPAVARNTAISHAKGDVVAMTDDDCLPPLDWLERIDKAFKKYPEVIGVTGYQEAPREVLDNNLIARYERFLSREVYDAKDQEVVGGWDVPAGVTNNLALKREVLEEVNGFDESFPVPAGEDADLKKRITDKGYKLVYIPLKVAHYQTYTLKGFLKQQYTRGIGSVYFRHKWEKDDGPNWLIPLKSIPRFMITLWQSKNISFAALEFLGRLEFFKGELKGARNL